MVDLMPVLVGRKPQSLQRMNVHHDGMVDILHLGEGPDQRVHVVALLHIPVVQAEGVEDIGLRSAARRAQPGQRPVHAAEILGDRHFVVVEHDDEIAALLGRIVQPLERHAGAQRAVADHRDHIAAAACRVTGFGQSAGQGDGSAGMTKHELVVLAFLRVGESGGFTGVRGIEIGGGAAGEHLMHIALMGYIEYDAVARRAEHAVQGDSGLHQTEIGTDMATMPMAVFKQGRTDFGT